MKRNLLALQNMIIGALTEGANDQKHRQEAEKGAEALIRAAKVGSIKPKFSEVKGNSRAVFDISKISGSGKVKKLIITAGPKVAAPGEFFLGILNGEQRIHIKIPDTDGNVTNGPDDSTFSDWIESSLGPFLQKYRSSLVHEYIHSIDIGRIPDKRAVGVDPKNKPKYFNDPLETNAFSQEGMSDFSKRLDHVKTAAGAKLVMGPTPQEFWKRLEKAMNPTFMAHLTADNKKKLQKRSYQFWQDQMKRFEERA